MLSSFLVWSLFSIVSGKEGFYNIAHMVNTIPAVDWALGRGANGVEIDLQFNFTTGELLTVQHKPPCDCTCVCPPPDWHKCEVDTDHVCSVLINDVQDVSPCYAGTPVKDMFKHIASRNEIQFLYLDSKVERSIMSINVMQRAGKNMIEAANNFLFDYNYGGIAVVGILKFDALPYLESAIRAAARSEFGHRIYFTVENEKNRVVEVLETLHSLPTSNIVYGTGLSSCIHGSPVKASTLELATINKVNGVVGMSYIWTVDNKTSMSRDLDYVQGIITNYPGQLYDLLKDFVVILAGENSTIPTTTSSEVIKSSSGYICNCSYYHEGCAVNMAAPRGLACKCYVTSTGECRGNVTQCHNTRDSHCKKPDVSIQSCLQGRGNCRGYNISCNCSLIRRGCAITQTPPPNAACKCIFLDATSSCKGEITWCRDKSSPYCRTPDKSVQTCVLGGGNCDGYTPVDCDCSYHGNGCYISGVAPRHTSCKCVVDGIHSCYGEVVRCRNAQCDFCKMPDKTLFSCFQGDGNCDGYVNSTCVCEYHNGGCIISTAPPQNSACHCRYDGSRICIGSLSWCRDPTSRYCRQPDTSRNTCVLGGGNCSGYRKKHEVH